MAVIERKEFAVTPIGVGRKDYSQNVEVAVEAQIRSYQEQHHDFEELDIPAGGSIQREIEIPSDFIVMLYDFYLSAPLRSLLLLELEFFSAAGTWGWIIRKYGYTKVAENISRGFPLFRKYRVTAHNYGPEDITAYFSAHGIQTAENVYYGRITTE